jgi:transketolase
MSALDERVNRIRAMSLAVRRDIVEMIHEAGSGHPGGSLSCVEILVSLYFDAMRIRSADPFWELRDRFILSKGHAAPALYAVLAERGFFPRADLLRFSANGSRLQKHIDMRQVPGTELSTGSLGQGLSVAVGMCLADRIDSRDRRVFVLLGDGECQEGQVWEAAMAAGHFGTGRLTAFLDYNKCQVDGYVKDICDVAPIEEKWRGFRWDVTRIDGHDPAAILAALEAPAGSRPRMIVADTVKGKGISFMENKVEWHASPLNGDQYRQAVLELNAEERRLASS